MVKYIEEQVLLIWHHFSKGEFCHDNAKDSLRISVILQIGLLPYTDLFWEEIAHSLTNQGVRAESKNLLSVYGR